MRVQPTLQEGSGIARREAVRRLAVLGAGLVAAGCTPLRIVLHLYPEDFDRDPALVDRVLRAFVAAVIPGAQDNDPDLTRAYHDAAYPLGKYASFLAADLCRRAWARHGTDAFHRLPLDERTAIIRRAVSSGGTTARLYNGAIFLAQVAFYSGIYDDDKGCALIEFEGRYRFRGLEATTYPDPERFLGRALTPDGNPA